ncbi:MAG: hypothetical protein HQL23_01420 [Candidatus Omnitrophica bacterium]|nr:hypothetical protein [Candidatus Omnitrophota bacterium]
MFLPRHSMRISVFVFFSFVWCGIWLKQLVRIWQDENKYYVFALNSGLNRLRSYSAAYDDSTRDYYPILKYCDRVLPSGEPLQIILPIAPQNKLEFLRDKGRYYLYPRNYGENTLRQKYILVYQQPDFRAPAGYARIKDFGPDKYLLTCDKEFLLRKKGKS